MAELIAVYHDRQARVLVLVHRDGEVEAACQSLQRDARLCRAGGNICFLPQHHQAICIHDVALTSKGMVLLAQISQSGYSHKWRSTAIQLDGIGYGYQRAARSLSGWHRNAACHSIAKCLAGIAYGIVLGVEDVYRKVIDITPVRDSANN